MITISEEVKKLVNEFETDIQTTAYEINCGYCADFANTLWARHKDSGIKIISLADVFQLTQTECLLRVEPWHVWVTYQGKHYDSECPEGVKDWRELPIFKRTPPWLE